LTKQSTKHLSIQVKLNGLSFCIFDSQSNTITHTTSLDFEHKLSPNDVLSKLKEELSTNTVFSEDFNTVQLIHFNELSTLVPKTMYNEAHHADYLKFNSKILKTDFIAADTLSSKAIINVYVPYMNINNYIFDTFGEFTYRHASTIFIDTILQLKTDNNNTIVYVNVENQAMQLAVVINAELQLYNFFEFTTPEDFIYYILFTLEQLQLDPETLQLYFSGSIEKNDTYFNIAYKYIRHVNFMSERTIENTVSDDTDHHKNILLKHSF